MTTSAEEAAEDGAPFSVADASAERRGATRGATTGRARDDASAFPGRAPREGRREGARRARESDAVAAGDDIGAGEWNAGGEGADVAPDNALDLVYGYAVGIDLIREEKNDENTEYKLLITRNKDVLLNYG